MIRERYGNLFRIYEKITGINAYKEPMKISPAAHFTMGGLWVDYELMTTVPGLFALGESNFSDHGANRLGANSLLQACVDGYFIAPLTVGNYLAGEIKSGKISTDHPEFEKTEQEAVAFLDKLVNIKGNKTADHYHKKLGRILWDKVGLERSKEGLEEAIRQIRELKNDFWHNLMVPGTQDEVNSELEKAGRVADYIELAELMAHDALNREESCGAHFRTEYQTEDGEAMRNDQEFAYVSSWEHQPGDQGPKLHKEMLEFEMVTPSVRSYK